MESNKEKGNKFNSLSQGIDMWRASYEAGNVHLPFKNMHRFWWSIQNTTHRIKYAQLFERVQWTSDGIGGSQITTQYAAKIFIASSQVFYHGDKLIVYCANLHGIIHWYGDPSCCWKLATGNASPCLAPRPCITVAIWRCRKNFSQWPRSMHWKLCPHWLKLLRQRHVAVVIQDPGWV